MLNNDIFAKISTISAERDFNGIIKLSIPYDTALINKVKSLPVRKWEPLDKKWLIPDTDENRKSILLLFGINIKDKTGCKWTEPIAQELRIRKYSQRTSKSYLFYNQDFIGFTGKVPKAFKIRT